MAELQESYAAAAAQMQRLTGFGAAVLAELSSRTGGVVPTGDGRTRPLPGRVAEAGGDSAPAAARMLQVGNALQVGLPRVAQAVLDGELPFVRAAVLTRLVGRIGTQGLAEAEPDLIVTAQAMDPVQLGHYVRHLIATHVEPVVEDEERRAHERRYLKTRTGKDGSVWGSFLLPGGDGEGLLTVVEALSRRDGLSDPRSAAQRGADALVARDRGCTRPPAMCDAHHLTARADGGPATLRNLVKREYDPLTTP